MSNDVRTADDDGEHGRLLRITAGLLAARSLAELEQDALALIGRELGLAAIAAGDPRRPMVAAWGREPARAQAAAAVLDPRRLRVGFGHLSLGAGRVVLAAERVDRALAVLSRAGAAIEDVLRAAAHHEDEYQRFGIDRLTRLIDRQLFSDLVQRELELCRRHGRAASLLLAGDLSAADASTARASAALAEVRAALRSSDCVTRRGATSFMVLLSDVGAPNVAKIAWRLIRSAVRASGPDPAAYVIGVASVPPWPLRAGALFSWAEAALLDAVSRREPLVIAGPTHRGSAVPDGDAQPLLVET